ncbi:MAG: deoxyribonuclease IV [Erysipelotrichales bacterium]|nr:deoxyribonuclease IV [Erysipelotrichales bacterium]
MKHIGAHVSVANGFSYAPIRASKIGANAFALFTKSPKSYSASEISHKEAETFKYECEQLNFDKKFILPHASYIINLSNPDEDKRKKSLDLLILEMQRCAKLGLDKLNFHPGAHLKAMTMKDSLKLIAEEMNKAIEAVPEVKLVIENTAGSGSNVGYHFEQISEIINNIDNKSNVGFCIDTCHTFGAGYDLNKDYDWTWWTINDMGIWKYLCGIHLNDSLQPLGSKKDRHANIGQGLIGLEFFEKFMQDDRFDDIPIILETPNSENWKNEITMLRQFEKN